MHGSADGAPGRSEGAIFSTQQLHGGYCCSASASASASASVGRCAEKFVPFSHELDVYRAVDYPDGDREADTDSEADPRITQGSKTVPR
jgi:hypothetical protein